MNKCLFCQFAGDTKQTKVVSETKDFLAFYDKFPKAPVHIICIPKKHISKKQLQVGVNTQIYNELLSFVHTVAKDLDLHSKGYEVLGNYSGYNHFDHEHLQILSGHH